MTEFFISIINLFFVPVISLLMFNQKNRQKGFQDKFLAYLIFVVLEIVLSFSVALLIFFFSGLKFEVSSMVYTIISAALAIIVGLVATNFKFSILVKNKKEEKNEEKQN